MVRDPSPRKRRPDEHLLQAVGEMENQLESTRAAHRTWVAFCKDAQPGPATSSKSMIYRTLTARGVFYPNDAKTPEARLRYYASRFPMVEADMGFYAIPDRQTTERWVERTDADFTFNLKAHAVEDRLPVGWVPDVLAMDRSTFTVYVAAELGKTSVFQFDLGAEKLRKHKS